MVRIKHRYLLLHILTPNPQPSRSQRTQSFDQILPDVVQFHSPLPNDLTPQTLVGAIRDEIHYLYGDCGLGLASSGLVVKYLSPATATAIVRCPRNHYRLIWAALTFMTHLPNTPSQKQSQSCVMQVVRVSGTIKKAEEEAIRRARAAILKAKRDEKERGEDVLVGLLGTKGEQIREDQKEETNAALDALDDEDEMSTDEAD